MLTRGSHCPSLVVHEGSYSIPLIWWGLRVICHNSKARSSLLTMDLKRKFKGPLLTSTLLSQRWCSWTPGRGQDLSRVTPCMAESKTGPRFPGSQAGCLSTAPRCLLQVWQQRPPGWAYAPSTLVLPQTCHVTLRRSLTAG